MCKKAAAASAASQPPGLHKQGSDPGMWTPTMCSSVSQAVPVGLGSSQSVWGQSSAHWRGSLFIISYFISVKLYDLHEILWFTALPIWSITTAYNNLCTDMPLRTFLIVKIVFKINVKLI